MTSQGTPSSRSYWAATGRMTSRANRRQVRLELELIVVEPEIHGVGASAVALTD